MYYDSYIDNLCAQSNDSTGKAHCDKAAIISLDGGAALTSPNNPHGIRIITFGRAENCAYDEIIRF